MKVAAAVACAAAALCTTTAARADVADVGRPSGFWFSPADQIALRVALVDEHQRPYSTPVRPRQIAGVVDLSCEYTEGRPCGPGAGAGVELDSAAGYGRWVSAFTPRRVP